MIELPRAALRADEIAEVADFFSFGTNDLTQTTLAFSRDDAEGKFLTHYLQDGVLERNPFESLDLDGVGDLMRIAVERGRGAKPGIKLGICGEHGGEPRSIAFCHELGLDYVSCSPFRVPLARLAAAQAALARRARARTSPRAAESATGSRGPSQYATTTLARSRPAPQDAERGERAEPQEQPHQHDAGDQPADVTADRDAREREREDEVQHDQPGDLPAGRDAAAALEDEQARRGRRRSRPTRRRSARRAQSERARRAGDARDEVEQQEPPAPDHLLEDRAGEVEASTCSARGGAGRSGGTPT